MLYLIAQARWFGNDVAVKALKTKKRSLSGTRLCSSLLKQVKIRLVLSVYYTYRSFSGCEVMHVRAHVRKSAQAKNLVRLVRYALKRRISTFQKG